MFPTSVLSMHSHGSTAARNYVYEVEIQGDRPPYAWKLLRRPTSGAGLSTEVQIEKGEDYTREEIIREAFKLAEEAEAKRTWEAAKETVELFRTDYRIPNAPPPTPTEEVPEGA